MRIKHILQLKQTQKIPPWKNLATYLLGIDIHNFSNEFRFLMDNNRTKTINGKKPYYYQDIIYYIKNENKDIKTLPNPTTKNIYQKIIQEGSKQHKVAGENLWKTQLPTTEFSKIWKNTFTSYAQPFCKDLHYRVLHYSTKTNQYMHKCTRNINPECDYCRQDNIHLFIQCPRIKNIWTYYRSTLTKLTGKNHNTEQHLLTLSVNKLNKHTTKLTLTTIQIIIHEIWESRNNNKYDKTLIPKHTIINKINAQLRNIVQTHYKYHKLNETISIFQEQFCINEAIAKIRNNTLINLL